MNQLAYGLLWIIVGLIGLNIGLVFIAIIKYLLKPKQKQQYKIGKYYLNQNLYKH